jgi:hypothetical protein
MSARKIKRSLRVHRYCMETFHLCRGLGLCEQYRRWNQ